MAMEEWRPIKGYKGKYEISSLGRVRSLGRWQKFGVGRFFVKEHFVALLPNKGGYLVAALWKNGKQKGRPVHQLVLEAWVGKRPKEKVACHNDGSRVNNTPDNLRWDTYKANSNDIDKHGTRYRGEAHHSAKLTAGDVVVIRRRIAQGEIQMRLAREYGVTPVAIGKINRRISWAQVP
jgi:hypothetical protein